MNIPPPPAAPPRAFVQFFKYGLCGGFATVVDMAVFYAVSLTVIPALAADDPVVRRLGLTGPFADEILRPRNFAINRAIAFLFSNAAAYLTNVRWVFEPGRHRRHVEIGLFLIVSGFSMAVGLGMGWSLIHWGGFSTTFSYAGNMAASILINYACRKYVVFKG